MGTENYAAKQVYLILRSLSSTRTVRAEIVTNPPPGPAVTLRLDQVSTAEEAKLWIENEPGTVRGYLSEVGDIHDHIAGKRLLSVAYQALSTMNTETPSRNSTCYNSSSNLAKTPIQAHK